MSKTAIITGAGTGIGAGIAVAFAEAGYNLALVGRRVEPLEETARQCGYCQYRDLRCRCCRPRGGSSTRRADGRGFRAHRYFGE